MKNLIITLADVTYPAVAPWTLMPILCILGAIITGVGIVFLTRYLLKKDKESILNLIMFGYGVVFLGLEIYHQINRYIDLGSYDFTSIPWQVCSIPIYACLIIPWIKKGLVKDSCLYFLGFYYIVAGIFPLLFGQAQLCRWPQAAEVFRSFLWHIMIVHVAIISLSMRKIGTNLKYEWKPLVIAISIFVGCTIVAQLINVTCHYVPGGGASFPIPEGAAYKDSVYAVDNFRDPDTCSCFYISPFFKSNMPVYSFFWEKLGWVANYAIYLLSFSLLAVVIYFAFYGYRKLVEHITNKKNNNNENIEQPEN